MKGVDSWAELVATDGAWERTKFLASAMDSLSASIAILDQDGTILAVNAAWRRHGIENGLQWTDFGVGRSYLAVLLAAAASGHLSAIDAVRGITEVMAGLRDYFWLEYPCPEPGTHRWFTMHVTRFDGPGGRQTVVAHQDITELKVAESELRAAKEAAEAARSDEQALRREAEGRRRVAETLADILTALNSNLSLDEILNDTAERAGRLLASPAVVIYGTKGDTGEFVLQASHGLDDDHEGIRRATVDQAALARAVWTRRPLAISDTASLLSRYHPAESSNGLVAMKYRALLVVPIVVKDQIYGGMLLYYDRPRRFSEDEVEMALLFGRQISLAVENLRLRQQVVQSAANAERSRLARDLHDAVTQTLFSASLMAEALPRVWQDNHEAGEQALDELRQLTRGALAEMRTLLVELRPAALEEKPVSELLQQLADASTSRTRVPIRLTIEGKCDLLPAVKISLYRIAQEALNNITKHADATQVEVTVTCQPSQVVLQVSDNGRGFEPGRTLPDQFGLNIMRERAESIGAELCVESEPGHGTRVEVVWQPPAEGSSNG